MPSMVYTNAYVSVNGVELSHHVKSVNMTYEAELLDDTVMGTGGTRSNKPGLKNWSAEINFLQDYADPQIDAALFSLVGADAFPISIRPVNAPASPTNPEYTGPAVVESYPPITGEVGALAEATVSFRPSGNNCNLRRLTAPLPDTATAGTPGTWTPAPPATTVPDSIAIMNTVAASPTSAWAVGSYMDLGDGTKAYWDSSKWVAGVATGTLLAREGGRLPGGGEQQPPTTGQLPTTPTQPPTAEQLPTTQPPTFTQPPTAGQQPAPTQPPVAGQQPAPPGATR